MYQPLPCITEDLETLQARLRSERDPQLRPRLHLLVLLKSGQVTTRRQAATHLAVHRNTVALWLRTYRDGELTALLTYKEPGAPSGQKSLPAAVFEQLQARLATSSGFASYIESNNGCARRSAWRCPIKPCTALCATSSKRRSSVRGPAMQKNAAEAAHFIKQCSRRLGTIATLGRQAPDQPVRVFCQDESRLGLHMPIRRRLTGYGVKPVQVIEPLYAYYWLYAAVEPTTGEAFWWELPRLDADCFSVFLRQFGKHYADSLNIVLLDQAPAHVAQRVQSPENIILVWLPAYSPELNPVERLWEDLKRRIDVGDARVRSSLAALQEHVAGLIRRYTAETIASLTGYAYLVDAIDAL